MWLLHPPKSRRRWHVFTWLAAVPALVFVALVQIRGIGDSDPHRLIQPQPQWYRHAVLGPLDEYGQPDFDREIDELYKDLPELVEAYEHGWPMPWLHRALGYGSGRWRSMSFSGTKAEALRAISAARWPLTSDIWQVAPIGLAVNLLVAATLITLPMLATETWLRRRGGLGRFKIIDFLVVAALCAAGFGFWRWDRAEEEREHRTSARIEHLDMNANFGSDYIGPDWIARLLGEAEYVPILRRPHSLQVECHNLPHLDYDALAELHHLQVFTIKCDSREWPGTDIRLAELARLPELRELALWTNWREQPPLTFFSADLRSLTQIETVRIYIECPIETALQFRHLPRLRQLYLPTEWYTDEELTSLEQTFAGVEIIPAGDTPRPPYREEQIAVRLWGKDTFDCSLSDDAKTLRVQEIELTLQHWKDLERILPRLEDLTFLSVTIHPDAVAAFGRMSNLKSLSFWQTRVSDPLLRQIETLPHLKVIEFVGSHPPIASLRKLNSGGGLKVSIDSGTRSYETIGTPLSPGNMAP